MKAVCNDVVERVALGEPLDELTEHAASCERCKRVIAMPRQLASAHHRLRSASGDPGLGFSARMTVAAQQRIGERRRRRIAGTLATTVAAGALAFFVVTRSPNEPEQNAAVSPEPPIGPTQDETPVVLDDADVAGLVRLADTQRARKISAPWRKIERPLAAYRKLVKGVTP